MTVAWKGRRFRLREALVRRPRNWTLSAGEGRSEKLMLKQEIP